MAAGTEHGHVLPQQHRLVDHDDTTAAGTDNIYYAFPWFPATYNSPALSQASVLDGPIDVSLYVTSTTPDALVAATVNLVAPTGAVTKLGDGSLLASMRALDTQQSWSAPATP